MKLRGRGSGSPNIILILIRTVQANTEECRIGQSLWINIHKILGRKPEGHFNGAQFSIQEKVKFIPSS